MSTEITEITIYTVLLTVTCPHCGDTLEGFIGDPRGKEFTCDNCLAKLVITEDADIKLT